MAIEFTLPDLGEGITEAEIVAVLVKPGETIKEDQGLFEVETDKATVTIPSPFSGVVEKVLAATGQIVTVGSIMITVNTTGGAAPAKEKETAAKPAAGTNVKEPAAAGAPAARAMSVAAPAAPAHTIHENGASGRPVPAAPAVRLLARELNVDLNVVHGSGPGGRVLKDDVRNHVTGSLEQRISASPIAKGAGEPAVRQIQAVAQESLASKYGEASAKAGVPLSAQPLSSTAVELPDFSKFGPIERIPMRSIRRKIAQNMAISWSHIPHVTTCDEADVTQLDAFLSQHQEQMKEKGIKLTLTVFALKAIASALKKYPQFNASLDERTGEIIFKHYFNIGVAVATEKGLIVPVISNVDKKSVAEVARELAEIADKTRKGKIELERLQGGTFTLTNIGPIGGTNMSPMINFPEAAILGMAKAAQKPVVRDGKIEIGLILPLALSFDHRIADGAEAAHFVTDVVHRLQNPLSFLLEN